MFALRKKMQAGFTLIEILVALALITLLAVGISLTFDGTRSRAQTLVSTMSELAAANMRLKNDTGCYADIPALLFDSTYASNTNANFCGRSLTATWNGPYVAAFPTAGTGLVNLDKVADGVTIDFIRANNIAGGARNNSMKYIVRAAGLPDDIVRAALFECNGSDANVNDFRAGKCRGTAGTGSNGTFEMLFDETR